MPTPEEDARDEARELDGLYKEVDKIYYRFARGCGISTCAYWMMYDLERAGGTASLLHLTSSWAYSKQTINSALKSLEAKGLIVLAFVEGSRKNKTASFTKDGAAFAQRYVVPAIEAERRAFCALEPELRTAFIQGARAFAASLSTEFDLLEEKGSDA